MTPVEMNNPDIRLNPPVGVSKEECGKLAVKRIENCLVSQWKPSEVELAKLNAGGFVYLWIYSTQHPMVGLTCDQDYKL